MNKESRLLKKKTLIFKTNISVFVLEVGFMLKKEVPKTRFACVADTAELVDKVVQIRLDYLSSYGLAEALICQKSCLTTNDKNNILNKANIIDLALF